MNRPDLATALARVYATAQLDPANYSGIVPLYDLISAYPLRVAEVRELSYVNAARFVERETGQPIPMPKANDRRLDGFLYIYQYGAYLYGFILVKKEDPVPRRRFTAAHELGHYVLHFLPQLDKLDAPSPPKPLILAEGLMYDEQGDTQVSEPSGALMFTRGVMSDDYELLGDLLRIEREANEFAAELLMPEAACRTRFDQESQRLGTRGRSLARRLASEFLVSQEAMAIRLARLGLLAAPQTVSLRGM